MGLDERMTDAIFTGPEKFRTIRQAHDNATSQEASPSTMLSTSMTKRSLREEAKLFWVNISRPQCAEGEPFSVEKAFSNAKRRTRECLLHALRSAEYMCKRPCSNFRARITKCIAGHCLQNVHHLSFTLGHAVLLLGDRYASCCYCSI